MKVELIAYTPNPDEVCGLAAKTCTSEKMIPLYTDEGEPIPRNVSLYGAVRSGHESVIEHASFTFAISGVSRALTHQLVRHRMASYSQQSQRYVNMDSFEYVIPESIEKFEIKSQDDLIKLPEDEFRERFCMQYPQQAYCILMEQIDIFYKGLVKAGIPEEDARYILPNACMTNIVVTMNARELRHFFALRCCTRAQWEIRELADRMLAEVKEVAPIMFENAGPSCVQTGRCPEGKKSCGRATE